MINHGVRTEKDHANDDVLTITEHDSILPMMLKGMTNQEMADETMTGMETIKTHVAHIVRKLTYGGNRAKAVYQALKRGLVAMP